jgi:hypothetical protein
MLHDDDFRGDAPVSRTITLADGSERPLYFREINRSKFSRYFAAQASGDEDQMEAETARLISASLCNPDGTDVLNIERAATLKAGVSTAMLSAILEINGLAKSSPNESAPGASDGSGTSSLSH